MYVLKKPIKSIQPFFCIGSVLADTKHQIDISIRIEQCGMHTILCIPEIHNIVLRYILETHSVLLLNSHTF